MAFYFLQRIRRQRTGASPCPQPGPTAVGQRITPGTSVRRFAFRADPAWIRQREDNLRGVIAPARRPAVSLIESVQVWQKPHCRTRRQQHWCPARSAKRVQCTPVTTFWTIERHSGLSFRHAGRRYSTARCIISCARQNPIVSNAGQSAVSR